MERRYAERINRVQASAIRQIMKFMADPEVISLGGGNPAPESFPVQVIMEIAQDLLEKAPGKILQYGVTMGYDQLRQAYLEHMVLPKGVKADLDNILCVTGSTQGISLALELFLDKGDKVLVENPTFLGTTNVMRKLGAELIPVEMDEGGVILADLEEKIRLHQPKLLYIIPNFQNPTGRTLAKDRRQRIAQLAAEYNVIVLEDDPYGDVRMRGEALPPIKSFDEAGNVIMMNSFSKIISPGMRVGAVTAAADIIGKMEVLKQGADVNTANLNQAICAEFLNRGLLPEHLQFISNIYRERLDTMLHGLETYFPKNTQFTRPDGGLFVWVKIPGVANTTDLLTESITRHKVAFVPGSPFCVNPADGMDCLRLNFSMCDPQKIDTALQRLGSLVQEKMA